MRTSSRQSYAPIPGCRLLPSAGGTAPAGTVGYQGGHRLNLGLEGSTRRNINKIIGIKTYIDYNVVFVYRTFRACQERLLHVFLNINILTITKH